MSDFSYAAWSDRILSHFEPASSQHLLLDDECFGSCFYAQILASTQVHRSVSHPPTPKSSDLKQVERRVANHLLAEQRKNRPVASYETSAVALRAQELQRELQELIDYTRKKNQESAEFQQSMLLTKQLLRETAAQDAPSQLQ